MLDPGGPLAALVRQRWAHALLVASLVMLLAPTGADQAYIASLRSAEVAVRSNRAEPALEALELALAAYPTAPKLLPLAAEAALRAGRLDQAEDYLNAAAAAGVSSHRWECQWARVRLQRGEVSKASSHLQRTDECPLAVAELKRLALEAFEAGEWNEAVLAAGLALQSLGSDAELELILIKLEAARDPRLALPRLRTWIQANRATDPNVHDLLAALREASLQPQPAFRFAIVGQAFARGGSWRLAALAFEQAVEADPTYTQARAYLGLALERTGQSGRDQLLAAFENDPHHPLPLAFLSSLLLEEGRADRARALMERAVQNDPDDPALLVQLASAQAAAGDLIAARASLIEAASLAPDQPEVWLALANFSLRCEIELADLGMPAARRAVLLAPDSALATDYLGLAHLLIGDPSVARRLFIRSVELDPLLTSGWYHLGLANLELGDILAARAALERVQALDPDGHTSELARRALAQLP